MKSNLFTDMLLCAVLISAILWGCSSNAENGPFCALCETVTKSTINETDYDSMVADIGAQTSIISAGLITFGEAINGMLEGASAMKAYAYDLYSSSVIDESTYNYFVSQMDSVQIYYDSTSAPWYDIGDALDAIKNSLASVVIDEDLYCVTCTSDGTTGGGGDDCTCTCVCPDYSAILSEMSARILAMKEALLSMKDNLQAIRDAMIGFYEKWQLQDTKLQEFLDELQPMLTNIKKYYDDYYSSSFDATAWTNIKKVVDDLVDKDVIKEFSKMLNDYNQSSFNSASWTAMSSVAVSWESILSTDTGFDNMTGEGVIKKILSDYAEQVESPIGTGYSKSSSIETEAEWLALNWWQRITAALGMMLFPKEEEESEGYPTLESEQSKADAVKESVQTFGVDMTTKFKGLFTSYQTLFVAFKDIFPTDTFPTSIPIHGGWSFQVDGGESVPAIERVDWLTDDTPTLKTSCDMIRALCGLVWWVTGFFIMFSIIRGCYAFIVVVAEKVLLVVGSLGRAGGGAGSGV